MPELRVGPHYEDLPGPVDSWKENWAKGKGKLVNSPPYGECFYLLRNGFHFYFYLMPDPIGTQF